MSHDTRDDESNAPAASERDSPSAEFQAQSQGPSAEFQALRQEIETRRNIQHNLLALQLTAAAVIFSFALSGKGRSEFLLIIPICSFTLCVGYVYQEYGMNNVGRYIEHELSRCVPGGLNWESWLHDPTNVPQIEVLRRVSIMVAFAITAVGALAWAVPNVFWSGYPLSNGVTVKGGVQAAIIIIWIIGLVASVSNIVIILRVPHKPKEPKFIAASIERSITVTHPRYSRRVRFHSLRSLFGFPVWTVTRKGEVASALEKFGIRAKPPITRATPHEWIVLSLPQPDNSRADPPPDPVSLTARIRGHIDEAALHAEVIGLLGRGRYQRAACGDARLGSGNGTGGDRQDDRRAGDAGPAEAARHDREVRVPGTFTDAVALGPETGSTVITAPAKQCPARGGRPGWRTRHPRLWRLPHAAECRGAVYRCTKAPKVCCNGYSVRFRPCG